MFHALYDSAWQHPGIAWIAGAALLLACLLRRPPRALLALFVVLELEIVLDAWFTGGFSPVGATGRAAEIAGVVFVILGDLRYFYLVLRQRLAWNTALSAGLAISLVVPVATGVLHTMLPARFSGTTLFLVYELAVLVLVVVLASSQAMTPYLRRLLVLEATQYALWALADVLILSGLDFGYLLRIVPNALYYAVFVPVACWGVPEGTRA